MATFNLKDGLNGTNNPSADGIFEYGWYHPTTNVFTPFNSYGYTDNSITPPTAPYDSAKIVGWHDSASNNVDVAIVFDSDSIDGSTAITPQPFPLTGIYLHPTTGRNVGVRMHLPSAGTLSATGTIQAASIGCGSDIGYKIRRTNSVDILSRVNLPKSNSTTNISLASVSVAANDYIDFIVDIGDDGTDFCDDTALDISYTVSLAKVPTPILQGNVTCSSTTMVYNLAFQSAGSVELYKVGTVSPIATASIVQQGYNGVVTFTSLNLLTGGSYYTIAKNTGQTDSDESIHTVIAANCYTAIAVDDNVGNQPIGTTYTLDVSTNDTPCNIGNTTYTLVGNSEINVTGVVFTGSTVSYSPTAVGDFSFQYIISCNNSIIDTAIVSGVGINPCISVSGGVITGNLNPYSGSIETYVVSNIVGTSPYTYVWVVTDGIIISGQGTNTIEVQWL